MAFTLICHVCGHKLKLFDSSIKKRKGMIRCPHCSARISYDLDSRKIQKSGFWAAEEPALRRADVPKVQAALPPADMIQVETQKA